MNFTNWKIKLFILSLFAFLYGCADITSGPGSAGSNGSRIEVYSPAANDTIGFGKREIIYDIINPSGIKFLELYINNQFVRNYSPNQNGTRPAIYLNFDSTYLNMSFDYYVIYYDLNGGSSKSKEMKNILISFPKDPPYIPYNVRIISLSNSAVNISWKDSSYLLSGFELRKKSGFVGNFVYYKTVDKNIFNINDDNLSPDTVYYYKIRATNQYGNSEFSVVVNSAGVGGSSDFPPPTNLNASAVNYYTVNLTWQDNSSNENYFAVERRNNWSEFKVIKYLNKNTITYKDSIGVYGGSEYYYRIKAYSASDSSWSNTAYVKTP